MIVVVEPTMRVQGVGSINIEDTTVVTEEGCEVLTSSPREWDAFYRNRIYKNLVSFLFTNLQLNYRF